MTRPKNAHQPRRTPTKRQVSYLENRAQGMTKRRAALVAGYSQHTADNAAVMIEDRAGTRIASANMKEAMAKAGLTSDILLQTLKAGLKAVKHLPQTQTAVVDYDARLNYAKYLTKLAELEPAEVKDITSGGRPLIFSWESGNAEPQSVIEGEEV